VSLPRRLEEPRLNPGSAIGCATASGGGAPGLPRCATASGEGHPWVTYSYCSDSKTSSRDARRAGGIAASTPARPARISSAISEPTG
jgi:hypothetical protein